MKANRIYPKMYVTKKAEKSIKEGHPWIYNTEITKRCGKYENGDLVDVISLSEKYLGTGFINDNSKINIRLISNNANDKFDEAFFERRLRYAWQYRKTVMGSDISCCRIIFGEADFFPGLTVDRFNDILVTQTLSLGIEKIKSTLFNLLYKILKEDNQNISSIYERNDVAIRELEGMEQSKGFFKLDVQSEYPSTQTIIKENNILYNVDFENGQKTGFFLDQKYNRYAVSKMSKGKNVLDCFTHTGSFALNAAKGEANSVLAVDISEEAIKTAKRNIDLNNFNNIDLKVANVFDLLPAMMNEYKNKFDFIILDPPAFTKSRSTLNSALRGYKEINLRAMKLLPRGGYLATCSCSHFVSHKVFYDMIKSAANDANVSLRQIEFRQQSPDHPIAWNIPETDYLKFYLFQVL